MHGLVSFVQYTRATTAARLNASGVGDFALIAIGFVVAMAAAPLLATGHSWIALPVLLGGLLIAALGRTAATERVKALSATFDLVVFAGVPFGFALGDPSRAVAASFLLFGLIALGAASLVANANRALAETDRLACIVAFALMCAFPLWFSLVAYVLGISCFAAAGARVALALMRSTA
ncbi:MAG TPA: hypothetical protein VMF58_04950 [Rhizomicrobium sp.]|nr:hypothetical protein [Rhizomicrobium sp.]